MTNMMLDLEPGKPGHLPFTIIIATKNEQKNIKPCLDAIAGFAPVLVVDSNSTDQTKSIAKKLGAQVHDFEWDGSYPKKRQWILDNIPLPHDWVMFLDADERLPQKLKNELADLFTKGPDKDGYFIKSHYKINNHVCRHGMQNNKLCLFNMRKIAFPVVDDLACPGMGEIEGHYQPVSKEPFDNIQIGRLKHPVIHLGLNDHPKWFIKHENYAKWAACMTTRKAWPIDPDKKRQTAKSLLRKIPFAPLCVFLHSYIIRLGFLDGKAGWQLAQSRYMYYTMINRALRQRQKQTHSFNGNRARAH